MTLRTLISFDHALLTVGNSITPQTTYSSNLLQTTYGLPGAIVTANSGNPVTITNNGWMSFGVSNSSVYCGYAVSVADSGLFQNGATQAWIGFRTYANGGAVNTTCNCFGILPSTANGSVGGSGTNIVSLINETQLSRLVFSVLGAQYVEVFLDIGNNVYQTYVNGIANVGGTLPVGFTHFVYSGQSFSTGAGQSFRDFYFLDVDSTKPNGRLGPITSTPLPPTSSSQEPNYGNFNFQVSNGATISSTQSKFGGSSLFPGATASANVAIPDNANLRTGTTGDVTYECWVYSTSAGQTGGIVSKDTGSTPYGRFLLVGGNWQLYADTSATVINVASGMVVNTWYHIALVRYQGVWTLYQNGVALATYTGGTFGNNAGTMYIGNSVAMNAPWQGYIDEFRMSNVARYTAAFTPPIAPFTADANTTLLMHFDTLLSPYVADHSGAQPNALQASYGGAFAMLPAVQNAPTNDTMSLRFSPTVQTGQKVVAMQYKMAAQVPFAMNMLTSLVNGANTKTLPAYQFRDTTAIYGRDLTGVQATAPDGTAWGATNIAATSLVLQPQSTTAGSTN